MSANTPEVIDERNLSHAWARAFLTMMDRSDRELAPLTISITGFDASLAEQDKYSSAVSGLTIFPYKYWDREGRPECRKLSEWYLRQYLPRLKARDRLNKKGTYFERMIAYHGVKQHDEQDEDVVKNQLQHIIDIWNRDRGNGTRPRQSALQVACFDPAKDHTGSTRSGFPCLQQVSFAYGHRGEIVVSAYYPTQYIYDRAYGNYLGLCHLGHFMACEMGLQIARLNCFIAHPELGGVNKGALTELVAVVRDCLSINRTEPK